MKWIITIALVTVIALTLAHKVTDVFNFDWETANVHE